VGGPPLQPGAAALGRAAAFHYVSETAGLRRAGHPRCPPVLSALLVTNRLDGMELIPGRYELVATPASGEPQTIRFSIPG
jgi:hypothetical protein